MMFIRLSVGACLISACWSLNVGSPSSLRDAGDTAEDFGLSENEWFGLEQDDERVLNQTLNQTVNMAAAGSNASTVCDPDVLIMGLFNVGTNLLNKLLNLNGLTKGHCDACMNLWKHVKPSLLYERFEREGRPNVLKYRDVATVMIVRDPMSWLQSMRKAPYDLQPCMWGTDWPTRSCTFPPPRVQGSTVWGSTISHSHPFPVANVEAVWNEWTTQYHALGNYGFASDKTIIVSYEEIVLDTEGTLARIAKTLGKPAPVSMKQVQAPAKNHGQPNGRIQALAKLRQKSYLHDYSDIQRREACRLLNKNLMKSHGYSDCPR
jgi:hypothetical protein